MKFAGLLKQSLVDYPGKIAAVLFTRGCNFRCPYCHNSHLLVKPGRVDDDSCSESEIMDFLSERTNFLDAVVLSGGEPCLNEELPRVCRDYKQLGYMLKIDTNGTRPMLLEKLLGEQLVDYIAMDIKAPLKYEKYLEAAGRLSREEFFNLCRSIYILQQAPIEVEFRTTVVPSLLGPADIADIARYIKGAGLYTLQQYNPRITLDPEMGKVKPYSKEVLEEIARECERYIKKVRLVNV